jgi:hypothetical protein
MKDNLTGVIIGALLVVVIIIGVLHYQKVNNKPEHSGSLYVGITDASADISNINDIDMSVKKVEIHDAQKGWVTLGSDTRTYQLLSLKSTGAVKFYTREDVEAGSYDKVRVTLGDTTVHTKSNGDMKAAMPSSQIVFDTHVTVAENESSSLKLDFLADKSLHAATDNKYVFAPVVRSEARSKAEVKVASDDTVTVNGGSVDTLATVGMDLDGSSKSNFELATDNTLQIGAQSGNNLTFTLGGKSYTSDNSKVWEDQGDKINTNGLNINLNADGSAKTQTDTSTTNSGSNTSTNGSLNLNVGH